MVVDAVFDIKCNIIRIVERKKKVIILLPPDKSLDLTKVIRCADEKNLSMISVLNRLVIYKEKMLFKIAFEFSYIVFKVFCL